MKKPTLVCLRLSSLPLKAGASTYSWSRLLQRPTNLCEKNFLLVYLTLTCDLVLQLQTTLREVKQSGFARRTERAFCAAIWRWMAFIHSSHNSDESNCTDVVVCTPSAPTMSSRSRLQRQQHENTHSGQLLYRPTRVAWF